ncbi:MAG: N-acetylmuramoyl-L-alanine amidase [Xanthomonadales bacterium]|nr:N-acetylmuramoyl-L-alanine amidase [Xanthomonadales bacterium]
MTSVDIEPRPLFYADHLPPRAPEAIDLVVIHCTELPDLETARRYGERVHYPQSQTGNCGHYYVDRDGKIQEWVPPLRIAHHVRGFNERSIGVELVNRGRYPNWLDSRRQEMTEAYPDGQIEALAALLMHLAGSLPALRWICGHEQLDNEWVAAADRKTLRVRRKRDPGPLFPWPTVLGASPLAPFPGRAPGN